MKTFLAFLALSVLALGQNPPTAANVGQNITFTVAVGSGTPPFTFQWFKNSGSGAAAIPGATSATYVIPSAQLGDAGTYSVTVTNAAGSVGSNLAPVAVSVPAVIAGGLVLTITVGPAR